MKNNLPTLKGKVKKLLVLALFILFLFGGYKVCAYAANGGFSTMPNFQQSLFASPDRREINLENLLTEINAFRTRNNLPSLTQNSILNQQARDEAFKLLNDPKWVPNQAELNLAMTTSGYGETSRSYIVISRDISDAQAIVSRWVTENTTKEPLLSAKTVDIGIGTAPSQQISYPVVVLITEGKPKPAELYEQKTTTVVTPANLEVKIDCIGPDGKVFKTTQKECVDFNTAWKKVSPLPSPLTQSDIVIQNAQNTAKGIEAQICLSNARYKADRCDDSCKSNSNYNRNACDYALQSLGWDTSTYSQCLDENSSEFQTCLNRCTSDMSAEQNACLEKQKQ